MQAPTNKNKYNQILKPFSSFASNIIGLKGLCSLKSLVAQLANGLRIIFGTKHSELFLAISIGNVLQSTISTYKHIVQYWNIKDHFHYLLFSQCLLDAQSTSKVHITPLAIHPVWSLGFTFLLNLRSKEMQDGFGSKMSLERIPNGRKSSNRF